MTCMISVNDASMSPLITPHRGTDGSLLGLVATILTFSFISACSTHTELANRPSYDRDTGTWSDFSGYRSTTSSKKASITPSVPTSGQFTGHISYYGPGFHGKQTANGERYNQNDHTCAHKTLPFGTMLKITLAKTNKSVVVRVNDRGPYIKGRTVDLSVAAAEEIGLTHEGVGEARIEIVP